MADKKISDLTAATTPLAGTEVLPVVQSGATVQVSAANVTAGRAVSGSSFDVTGSTAPANGMYLPATNSVALSTNSSIRFRVDASGNAGLGVTPAAHGSSERSLDIGNTTSFGRQSDAALVANFNVFINTSSQYAYRISSFASSYQQLAGEHKFFTAPSGTAGNVVTLTQRMTITQSGDVGIGTATPSFTAGKGLHIYSTASAALRMQDPSSDFDILSAFGGAYLTNRLNGLMAFGTNGTERMQIAAGGNVGIGTTAVATALLDVQSTTKGVRFPNMTTTQKNAITPSAGTVVFDTTLSKLCVYSGAAWQTITSI